MKYKAVMIDVDGTLVQNKREGMPSEKVTKAVNKAGKIIHVGIATSRPLFLVEHIFKHLNLSGPSIINGGSQIIDIASKKTLWEKTITKDIYEEIKKIMNKHRITFFVHDTNEDKQPEPTYTPKKLFNVVAVNVETELAKRAARELSSFSNIAAHVVPDWKSGKKSIVISDALATKQHGILEVSKILGISTHEIIGIGDGENDMPLLMACGLKVAMGNAIDDLKSIADYVAPSVDEDGVADVIEKFVLNSH